MTTVVVGHGRSPEGRGWGTNIDACTTVIRMWDYEWQPTQDYGNRYDYGFFVITTKALREFHENNKRTPSRGWLACIGKVTDVPLPNGAILVDTTLWLNWARQRGAAGLDGRLTLTRGCAAAAWAIEHSNDVILVGFDNVRAKINKPVEESFAPEYWKSYNARFAHKMEKAYPTGGTKTATHDMEYELPLLQWLAFENSAQLRFAEDTWT